MWSAGCNPHRSLGRSLEPERERVGDRHEATHKGIRDPPLRDPGLPVEFEAGPDSPEILGRGLHGFFKRVGGSGDARSSIDARGWDIQEKQVLHDLLGETPVGPLQFGTKGLGPEVDKKGASYGALQMTFPVLPNKTRETWGKLVPLRKAGPILAPNRENHDLAQKRSAGAGQRCPCLSIQSAAQLLKKSMVIPVGVVGTAAARMKREFNEQGRT